jgi:hypothetical protein
MLKGLGKAWFTPTAKNIGPERAKARAHTVGSGLGFYIIHNPKA